MRVWVGFEPITHVFSVDRGRG